MNIHPNLTRSQMRRMRKMLVKTKCRIVALRIEILLLLQKAFKVKEVEQKLDCARATVYRTLYRFEELGEDGIDDQRKNRPSILQNETVLNALLSYIDKSPRDFGWQRSSWTLELFSLQLKEDQITDISPRYVKDVLTAAGCRRGRPRPALRLPIKGRRKQLQKIQRILNTSSPSHEVLYVDEADVDLNPRIGYAYIRKGFQPLVLTPGQNEKRYVAAGLNSRTGKLVFTGAMKKNSMLFVDLLKRISKNYQSAKRITLLLDNYVIHKSAITKAALAEIGHRIRLVFFPPYSPESNKIEILWKQMHDNVTRNHQFKKIEELMKAVHYFLQAVQPYPGTKVSTLKLIA